MPEAMPVPNFEGDEKNQDIGSDEKTLRKINELENKWKKLRNQIENTRDEEEKQILIINQRDLEKIIRQQYKYYDKVRNDKELNNLRKKAGEKNVAEVIDINKERKRRAKLTEDEKKLVGQNFLSDIETLKEKRGYK